MVYSVIQNFKAALKYRGGWKNLLEHMYTNGDYPFKMGTYMGCDAWGNRYYENKVDYPFGQHRWIEPVDIHNFDASQIPPEWHGWMVSQNDATPSMEKEYMAEMQKRQIKSEVSHAPYLDNVGHQEPIFNFHGMHNQSQIRSRGYKIGNPIVGLPPDAPDAFYTQPGSPYNDAFIRKTEYIGDLDEAKGGGRPYKSEMWKERLKTPEDIAEEKAAKAAAQAAADQKAAAAPKLSLKEQAILARGGTLPSK